MNAIVNINLRTASSFPATKEAAPTQLSLSNLIHCLASSCESVNFVAVFEHIRALDFTSCPKNKFKLSLIIFLYFDDCLMHVLHVSS